MSGSTLALQDALERHMLQFVVVLLFLDGIVLGPQRLVVCLPVRRTLLVAALFPVELEGVSISRSTELEGSGGVEEIEGEAVAAGPVDLSRDVRRQPRDRDLDLFAHQ